MEQIHIYQDKLVVLMEARAFEITLDQLADIGYNFYVELGATKTHHAMYDMNLGGPLAEQEC
jgi:hypothetical protein